LAAWRPDPDYHSPGAFLPLKIGGTSEIAMTDTRLIQRDASVETAGSAVSWPAIIAGAAVASALALALLMLGAGIGLVSVSPWSNNSVSATTFGALAAAWFIAVQLFASGVGGYLTGRLRTRWASVHNDEVYFRDTAHGLFVGAVGATITAFLLASAASSVASGVASAGASAVQAAGSAAAGPASQLAGRATANIGDSSAYFTDMLFRTDHPEAQGGAAASQTEVGRILATDAVTGDMPATDKTYVAQVVAARTGLSQADAEKRVSDVVAQAKAARDKAVDAAKTAADAARKTGVYVALWAFISLLVGAFSASYMATIGGRVRDDLPMRG
jgi:hypothetical protein